MKTKDKRIAELEEEVKFLRDRVKDLTEQPKIQPAGPFYPPFMPTTPWPPTSPVFPTWPPNDGGTYIRD